MSFGGFGTTTTQPTFGANQTQPTSGLGLFGQSTQQQQPATTTGGLFGTQQSQPQPATGLFGQPAQTATTASAPSGGLFGQNQPTTQAQPATGGLFGNQQQANPGGGGLFGNTATAGTSSGGLFGTTGVGATGGGLFGNQQQAQPAAGATFGQQAPSAGGGLFGNTSNAATTQAPATTSVFVANPFARPGAGATASAPLTISTLGGPSNVSQPQVSQSVTSASHPVLGKVEEIYNAWNSTSPSCRFQYYFYNMVDPQQVGLYGRPPNATNEALWQKAVRENPDPTCLVPVLALGFEDVKKRADAQAANAKAQQQQLDELASRLEAMAQKHALMTSVRAQKAAQAQTQIKQRITSLVQHLHFMIPTVRSSSIRPEEEALRAALESIDEELKRPGGLGRMKGKLSELWTAVGALGAMRERARKAGEEFGGWQVRDEASLNELAQILHNEQQGLLHLTNILKDDIADVEIIENGLSGGESRSKLGQSRVATDPSLPPQSIAISTLTIIAPRKVVWLQDLNHESATMATPLSPKTVHSPLPGVVSPTGLRPALKHTTSRPTSPIPSSTPPVLSPASVPQPLPTRSRQNSIGNGGSGITSRPLTAATPSGSRYTTKVSFDTFDAPNTDADTLFSFTLQVKSDGYKKTRNTRVYLCAASADESGTEALEWSISNLVEDGDELVVVRGFAPEDLQKDMHDQLREEAKDLMRLILERNSEYEGRRLSVVVEFVAGKVTSTIDRMTALYRPDSLVVGTRGSKGLMQTLGSAYCVSHSPVPVIVVRPEKKVKKTVEKRRADPKRRAQFE
ncbi:hypothetical protein FRB90_010144, partial [Tulasnella sp. 427]